MEHWGENVIYNRPFNSIYFFAYLNVILLLEKDFIRVMVLLRYISSGLQTTLTSDPEMLAIHPVSVRRLTNALSRSYDRSLSFQSHRTFSKRKEYSQLF
ncbi:hypothetical protein TNIN_113661 [Trichonephila inaurata madagascariensis]|uniref:Uncharacterized protein n=1 Tax=Trichonephila inaurata madagascariensis TaxID=2747483 RepID=A0A8X7BSJ4_9ARAC|nr:hypothetical protein TNIN_113661 [Trichonephila inaurata madagascariensis]